MPVIRELPTFKNIGIQKIVCGDRHILALNSCGTLFSCGYNTNGELGFDPSLPTNPPGVGSTGHRYDYSYISIKFYPFSSKSFLAVGAYLF